MTYFKRKNSSLQPDHMLLPKFLVRHRSFCKANKLDKHIVLMQYFDSFYMKLFYHICS
jgi:hypothetical protein